MASLAFLVVICIGQVVVGLLRVEHSVDNDRRGLVGSVSLLDVGRAVGRSEVSPLDPGWRGETATNEASAALKDYLDKNNLSMVVEPGGDGLPVVLVWDECNCVGWWHDRDRGREASSAADDSLYLAEGGYVAGYQARQGVIPYDLQGVEVAGTVPLPFSRRAQGAMTLDTLPSTAMSIAIDTDDLLVLQGLNEALASFELEIRDVHQVNLWQYLTRDSVLAVSLGFALAAVVCSFLFLWSLIRLDQTRLRISFRVGGTPEPITIQWVVRQGPGVLLGAFIGALMPLSIVALARIAWGPVDYIKYLVAVAGAMVLLYVSMVAVFFWGIRRNWSQSVS